MNRISEEDRLAYLLLQAKHGEALAAVKLAAKDMEIGRMGIMMRYGLTPADSINIDDGSIKRAPPPPAPPDTTASAPVDPPKE